jgi:polysaccharide biosynthesis protein PslH
MYGRHGHRAVRRALSEEVARESPIALYLDHLDSYQFATVAPGVPRLIDLHNVYSRLAERTAAERGRGFTRSYLNHEARLLGRVEAEVARRVECLLTVSALEQEHFRRLGARDVRLVPNGVDCAAYAEVAAGRPRASLADPVIVYVGALSWTPNVLAARFLAAEVLPAVRKQFPRATLQVIGRSPTADALELQHQPGVTVLGSVPDVRPYLAAASVLAVPLEAGGGTRLKILEAFAAGLPVVSTAVGCEGIEAEHGRHLVVADRPDFGPAICTLLADPAGAEAMASRARMLARSRYDWGVVGQVAVHAVEELSDRREPGEKLPLRGDGRGA